MPYFFYYLLKVMLCSAVLFGYYHLFLRNKVYHAYNRFYLLAITGISLLAPLFNFNLLFSSGESVNKPLQLLQVVNSSDAYLEEIVLYTQQNYLTTAQLIMLGYSMVSLLMLVFLVKVFVQILSILRNNSSRNLHDVVFVQSDAKGTPFSFFRFIFWNKAIDINTPTGRQIFAHELAHVREKHSADKLYLNLLLIVFWINPIFWFIKKELNLIHEFIADRKAVADNDAAALAAMIVQSAYPQHSYLLTSHFFYSPIKRRLKMLTKYNNNKAGYLYRILALPVVLFLVAALTIKAKSGITEMLNPAEKITVVIDAGHGGQDAGSRSTDQNVFEKNVVLSLVRKIKAENQSANIELIFTRETDVYQTPQEKVALAKKANADLFISLHMDVNTPQNPSGAGMLVYVANDDARNSTGSKLLASSIINTFSEDYGLKVAPNPMQRQVGIHVLKGNDCPAVIIEAGHISNQADLVYLQSEKGQTNFARNLLSAIARYAEANKRASRYTTAVYQDTLPNYGTYQGQRIKGIQVYSNNSKKTITIELASGKKVAMTEAEAATTILRRGASNRSAAVANTLADECIEHAFSMHICISNTQVGPGRQAALPRRCYQMTKVNSAWSDS
ncbi:MAG: N-acetylmuramoyl-L-alanine amidase, partial [Chitinophagaceae bacterium]